MCSRKQEQQRVENERKAEKQRLDAVEKQARLNCQRDDDERRQKVLAKLQEIQQRQIRDNLKVSWSLMTSIADAIFIYCCYILSLFSVA